MEHRKRIFSVQGVLSLLVYGLMPGMAAQALQPMLQPELGAQALLAPFAGGGGPQQPQQPRPKPDEPQPGQMQPDQGQTQPDPSAAKSGVFTGTIVKSGSDFVLRDSSGIVYRLDQSSKAEPFEGKPVKVTGKLDEDAKLIHVDTIESMSA